MSFSYKTKRTWADKAALFGLLAAGLLIAHFIVTGRAVTKFSAPIELDNMGLSISVPSGSGWESDKQWKYADNSFTLSSFFIAGSDKPTIAVHCHYLLALADKDPNAQIQSKARMFDGKVAAKGSLSIDSITVDWFELKVAATKGREAFEILFGTAQLPNERTINIEIRWSDEQEEMAKEMFERIIKGIEVKSSPMQDDGVKVLEQIKAKGLSRLLAEQSNRNYLVIKDTKGQPVGFVIDILADLGKQALMNIQAASSFYLRGKGGHEEVILFQSSDNMSEFVCKSESVGRLGRSGSEQVLDRTGALAIKASGTFIFGKSLEEQGSEPSEERFYRPGPAAIPDVLADFVYGQMLAGKYDKIMIDIIKNDGAIVPVIISQMEKDKMVSDANAAYLFEADFLDGHNSSMQIYLDAKLRAYKEVVRQQYVLETSNPEELKGLFPEKSDDILQPEE